MQSKIVFYVNHLAIGRWSLTIVLLLTLIGCGRATPTSESAPPTPAQSPLPTPTATPPPELQPMIVTLELWLPEELNPYGDNPGADVLAQQLDNFSNAYPDVQVEVVVKKSHGRGGLLDFLRTARDAAPSVMPDLAVLDATELEVATGLGVIQPLDAHLSPDDTAERFPFAVELGTVEEQTMGFVISTDVQHLAYRPALLGSPPVSWTQFISPSVSFLFPAGGRDRQVNDATLIQYLAAGGGLTDEEGNPTLDEEVMVSVLGFYSDCVNAATALPIVITPTITPTIAPTIPLTTIPTISPTAALSVSTTISPIIILPDVSMTISPTVVLGIRDAEQAWEQFRNGEGDIAVVQAGRYWLETDRTFAPAPIPTRDGRYFSIARRGWAIAMVANDPARQALAMLLFNWLIFPDHNGQWTQAAGYLPGTRSALRLWDVSSADRAMLRNVLDAAVPPPPPEVMQVVGPAMQDALRAVLRGWNAPEEATASAIESLNQ
jgi:ABC-type glycerol-3-phosphate transport system substrate-binding protein